MKLIGSSAAGQNTFIEIRIRKRKSRSGPATARIVRTSEGLILMMEVSNLSYRVVNLGAEVIADGLLEKQSNRKAYAAVHIQHSDDRESARAQSSNRMPDLNHPLSPPHPFPISSPSTPSYLP